MEQPTAEDLRADLRQMGLGYLGWSVVAVVAYSTSLAFLDDPGLSDSARTFWLVLPWPLAGVACIAWRRQLRRYDEFQLAVDHRASAIAWRFTFIWLLVVTFFAQAVGFPIPVPIWVDIGWVQVLGWPCVVWAVALGRVRRKLSTG